MTAATLHPLLELPPITPRPLDFLLLLILAVSMPIWARRVFRLYVARASACSGHALERLRLGELRGTAILLSALAIAVLLSWHHAGRSLGQIGLRAPSFDLGPLELTGWLLATAGIAATGVTFWLVVGRGRQLAIDADRLGDVALLIPETAAEKRSWWWVSLAAGVGEELAYRGFGMAVVVGLLEGLTPGTDPSAWGRAVVAALVTSLIFGLAHSYQGGAQIATTGAMGLYLATLYLLTGSLWAPMIAHFLHDLFQGLTLSHALHRSPSTNSESVPALAGCPAKSVTQQLGG